MVTVFLHAAVSICVLGYEAQLEQTYCEQAFQEPYNGYCQQLHFVPHFAQKVE
jgi:hypothetical protein